MREDLSEVERRKSLASEFIMRLQGIKDDLRDNLNIIVIYEKLDIFKEHYHDYIKECDGVQKDGE